MRPVIAVVGATGLVGRTFLTVMEEYQIEVQQLKLFASSKSVGTAITYRNQVYHIEELQPGCFEGVDFALFSAGSDVSKRYAKEATKAGTVVIDNSSAWRMEELVPLVVPEINLDQAQTASLIANPNCSTIQSVLPLYPLHQDNQLHQL